MGLGIAEDPSAVDCKMAEGSKGGVYIGDELMLIQQYPLRCRSKLILKGCFLGTKPPRKRGRFVFGGDAKDIRPSSERRRGI